MRREKETHDCARRFDLNVTGVLQVGQISGSLLAEMTATLGASKVLTLLR